MKLTKTRLVILSLCLGIGGCTYGRINPGANSYSQAEAIKGQGGVYKIGNPYQIMGTWYYPKEDYSYSEVGTASWYGEDFHARRTANNEKYDMHALTAAHRTLPLPSIVKVTNLDNGRSLVLRVNDRGPYAKNRIIDISKRGAQLLGFQTQGTAKVRVEIMAEESKQLKAALLGQECKPVKTSASTVIHSSNPAPAAEVSRNPLQLTGAEQKSQVQSAAAKGWYVQTGSYTQESAAQAQSGQLTAYGAAAV